MESTSPLTEFWVLEVVGTPSPARVDPAIALHQNNLSSFTRSNHHLIFQRPRKTDYHVRVEMLRFQEYGAWASHDAGRVTVTLGKDFLHWPRRTSDISRGKHQTKGVCHATPKD
jgi:hypothetical protein